MSTLRKEAEAWLATTIRGWPSFIEEEFYNCEWSAVENWSKFEVRK